MQSSTIFNESFIKEHAIYNCKKCAIVAVSKNEFVLPDEIVIYKFEGTNKVIYVVSKEDKLPVCDLILKNINELMLELNKAKFQKLNNGFNAKVKLCHFYLAK